MSAEQPSLRPAASASIFDPAGQHIRRTTRFHAVSCAEASHRRDRWAVKSTRPAPRMLTALLPLTVASFHPPLASRRGCILATSSARSRFVHASSADGYAFDPNAFFQRALTALPENPETAELQLRSGLRAALDAGERRILLDVRVPELDAASRGFMPQLLARFALAASQEAAVGNLPVLTLCHSLDASMQASLLTR